MKNLSKKEIENSETESINLQPIKKLEDHKLKDKPIPLEKAEKKEEVKKFNENPITKANGLKLISKRTYIAIWVVITFLVILLTINVFWGNLNASLGMFKNNETININVDTPDVPVTIDDKDTNNYEHTINVENKIELEDDVIDDVVERITDGVIKGVNNGTG